MNNKIVKSISIVLILSIIAKVIAFIKTIVQAAYFGATFQTDAYNMAYGLVSNILFMLTTALGVAFVPIYVRKREKNDHSDSFTSKSAFLLIITSLLITALLIIFSPLIIRITAPNYVGDTYNDTVLFFRILLLGFIFSMMTAIYQNVLNAEKKYGFSSVSSILNSITLIVMILILANQIGIWALVISVPISYLFQFAVLYFKGAQYGRISSRFGFWDTDIAQLLKLAFPILISQATVEINQVVDRALLSSVGEGAITAVSYATVLYQFAMHTINIPMSTVLFTELAEAGSKADLSGIRTLLNKSYRVILLLCLPIVVLVCFNSKDIVTIVYGHGKFDLSAIDNTSTALFGYIFCLIPVIIKSVQTRAYYSLNDTIRPTVISAFEVLCNIILSIILVKYWGILGVVGATAISSWIFVIVLLIDFNKRYISAISLKDLGKCWKIFVGLGFSIAISALIYDIVNYNSFLNFLVMIVVVSVTYVILLIALHDEIVLSGARFLVSRIKKVKKRDE